MFKILALVGAIAGGATYGLYAHTDLFKCTGNGCQLSASAEPKPCCQTYPEASPSCSEKSSSCCEEVSPCCAAKTLAVAGVAPACASQTIPVSVTKSACCPAPCDECVKAACTGCDACSTCCSVSAKAAIGGSAAFVAGALKK